MSNVQGTNSPASTSNGSILLTPTPPPSANGTDPQQPTVFHYNVIPNPYAVPSDIEPASISEQEVGLTSIIVEAVVSSRYQLSVYNS